MDTLIYDVETQRLANEIEGGWNNAHGMGLASAVVYSTNDDLYHFFYGDQDKQRLINMLNGNRVITFNGVKFDSCVVLANERTYKQGDKPYIMIVEHGGISWMEFDIFLVCIKAKFNKPNVFEASKLLGTKEVHNGSLNLHKIAEKNLVKINKSGDGKDAPHLFKTGQTTPLLQYNLQDVRVTKSIYKTIITQKFFIDGFGKKFTI